jgi:hypothetical protein
MNINKMNHNIELEFANNNPSYYFISTGHSEKANNIFYTLRKTIINTRYFDGMAQPYVDSIHIQNLSTDYNKAINKAKEITNNQKIKIISEKEMNAWGEGSYDKEEELLRKKYQWKIKSTEIINNYLSQYKDLEWSEVVPLTEDRLEFSGKILNTKYQENQFGGTLKMLFQDERGFKLWGSVPNKLIEENLENLKIKFIASVQVSKNDKSFGFFKRPTKIKILD